MSNWQYPRFQAFREELETAATAWFEAIDANVHPDYPYSALSPADWKMNIILPEVAQYVEDTGIRRDQRLHNGVSSQAFAFNLLVPFVLRNDLGTLHQIVAGTIASTELKIAFEYQDRLVFNETSQQPTTIDAYLFGDDSKLFIEVKLSEREFGGCSCVSEGNCEGMNPRNDFRLCYLHEGAKRTYWTELERHQFLDSPFFSGALCPLVRHYQFFREIAFALSKGGTLVLLVDERNPAFRRDGPMLRGLYPFLSTSIRAEYQSRFVYITIQSILNAIRSSPLHADWVPKFQTKYGIKV